MVLLFLQNNVHKMVERDVNYKLIVEIETYPMLYNSNLPEYSNKTLIEKAWKDISQKINLPVADCKEKWRNIRSSFIRSKKATPTGWKPKKPYYLAAYLGFILPYVRASQNMTDPSKTSISIMPGSLKAGASEEEQPLGPESNDQSQEWLNGGEEDSDHDYKFGILNDNDGDHTFNSFAESTQIHHHTGHARKRPMLEVDESPAPSPSPMHYFFLSLLDEFDSMSDSQIRQFKIRVLQLIDEMKSQ